MIYALMLTATLVTLLVGILCYALKMKNTFLVLLLQFASSFAASYGVAYWLGKGVFTNTYIAAVCAVISAVIFGVLYLLRQTIGPLNNREPGPWGEKMGRDHSRTRSSHKHRLPI